MSEFEDRLNSLLSDPDQMEKITAMAKSLMGSSAQPKEELPMTPHKPAGLFEGIDPAMLSGLTKALGSGGVSDEKRALLQAMQPYLSPKRREKLQRAMELARMISMAEIAFGVMGGGDAKI